MKIHASKIIKLLAVGAIVVAQSACESPNAHRGANVVVGAETTGMATEPARHLQVVAGPLPLFGDEAWQGTREKKWGMAPATDRGNADREPVDRYFGPDGFGASRPFGSGLDRPFGENSIYFGLLNYSF